MFTFYKSKLRILQLHMFPLYMLPILVGYTKSYQIIPMFTLLVVALLYLSTFWFTKLKILFHMSSCNFEDAEYILYKDQVCEINKGTFKYERSKYLIVANKISTSTGGLEANKAINIENKRVKVVQNEISSFIDNEDDKNKEFMSTTRRGKISDEKINTTGDEDIKRAHISNKASSGFGSYRIVRLKADTDLPYRFYQSEYKTKPFCTLKSFYSKNEFDIRPPSFIDLYKEHAVSPFFVFQIFSGILWCLDEYVYQSLFTIFMLLIVEAGMVLQRILNIKQFRTVSQMEIDVALVSSEVAHEARECSNDGHTSPQCKNTVDSSQILATRNDEGRVVSSTKLMPGDIIRIVSPIKLPCDLLLLKGACAVNEAMLSGESVPLKKEDINDRNAEEVFSYMKDKKHILFSGTEIVKLDSELECFVLHTGFNTLQGELIRKMMCSKEVTVNTRETFLFIFCLLVFALIASAYTYREGVKMKKTGYKILLEIILIITNVVPVELPMELNMAINSCVKNLIGLGIYSLEPFRIPYAGKIKVCCFDKTGTLTETNLHVASVVGNKYSLDVMRCCNDLIMVDGKLIGDPLELSVREFINDCGNITQLNKNGIAGEVIHISDTVCKMQMPVEAKIDCNVPSVKVNRTMDKSAQVQDTSELGSSEDITILKVYTFSADLRRMTVVGKKKNQVFVAMKGAPETVENYLLNVPDDYHKYKNYASMGYRVIAMAYKPYKATKYNRTFVEENMIFAGFVLFDSKLKPNASETISILQESGHKVVMITGDNLLTALNVANKLGIDGNGVEGVEIDSILDSAKFGSIGVFARADPSHKEKIIERYNSSNQFTLMCGDGTNDVGALKSAHIGVALVDVPTKKKTNSGAIGTSSRLEDDQMVKMGDASIAAPFTVKTGSLSSILDIIRQGRSALVTTLQMYKILALNSIVNAFSLSVLDCLGIRYGDFQLTATGLLIAFSFMFLTHSQPLNEISCKRPPTSIFSPYIVLSVLFQSCIHILSYLCVIYKFKPETVVYQEKFAPNFINTALFVLNLSQQVSVFLVNYIGRPYRESMVENTKLSVCLLGLIFVVLVLLFGMNGEFSEMMEVIDLGDTKLWLFGVLSADMSLCFLVERLCFCLFML